MRFIDAGALYGYFSLLAEVIFENIEIVSIEANPRSAKAISEAIKQSGANKNKYTVVNSLLSDVGGAPKQYVIQGFSFYEPNKRLLLKLFIENLIKTALNCLPFFQFRSTQLHREFIEQKTLAEFINDSKPGECTPIVKVDAEGFQAIFLPPAIPQMIEVGAILLLEFDSKERMSNFGITNFDLCQPFIDAGYSLFWTDHRTMGSSAVQLTGASEQFERDGLAVLIPQSADFLGHSIDVRDRKRTVL